MGVCLSEAELECRGDETRDGAQHQTSDDESCINCVLGLWEAVCGRPTVCPGGLMLAGGTISCD